MRTLFLLLFFVLCAASKTKRDLSVNQAGGSIAQESFFISAANCDEDVNITKEYPTALYDITLLLFKKIVQQANFQVVFSPFSIWKTLAALAAGADPVTQQRFFKFLSLLNDRCTLQQFYLRMGQRIQSGDDISISSSQTLVIDDNVKLNQDWLDFVSKNSLLNITSSPIKTYPPIATNYISQLISAPLSRLNLDGNSVILDSVDYNGLWTTAFSDAVVQRAPFHDLSGQKIGAVDLMVMKKKVKMLYVAQIGMKLLELPVGLNGRFSFYFGIVNSKPTELMAKINTIKVSLVVEVLSQIKESLIPLDVAIPRFTLTSNIDVRNILEDVGLIELWSDPAMTKFVSEPAALPSGYLQQASLTLNVHGLAPTPPDYASSYNASTGLDPELGQEFIANRPFIFSLIDRETYTCVFAAAYSQPTYNY